MKTWVVLLITGLVAGLGGLFIGKLNSSASSASPMVAETKQVNATPGVASPSDGPQRQSSEAGGMNVNVLRRELAIIKTDPNPINRFSSLTQLLGNLSEENLGQVLEAFDGIPMRYEYREEYQMLIYAWAGLDPEAALKFVDENAHSRSINKGDLLNPLIASWASNDPEKALGWIDTLPESQRTEKLMAGLMEGWAVNDPKAAAEYLQATMAPGEERSRLAGEIAGHLFKQNPQDAVEWAESQADVGFRAEAFAELAEDWAKVDPKGLASWLEKHAQEEYSVDAFNDLARVWVREDPSGATAYFEALPDGPAKESGIYEMAVAWGKDDLGALGQWLNDLPDSSVTDLGVKAYVDRLAEQSPQAAIDSALSINTEGIRDETVKTIGQQWFRQDPEGAAAWATANGISVETFVSGEETVKMTIKGEEIEIPIPSEPVNLTVPSNLQQIEGTIEELRERGVVLEAAPSGDLLEIPQP